MSAKPKVAVIGTGGTITAMSSLGPLDLIEYGNAGTMLEADQLVARYPEAHEVAEVIPIRFKAVPSPAMRSSSPPRRPSPNIRVSRASSSCTAPQRSRRRPTRSR
jgi:hypothetical protein